MLREVTTDQPTILIVDDDEPTQRLLEVLMQRYGFRTVVAANGAAAIDRLKERDFAAIILDLMMPHEGGMTVISHLRVHKPELLHRVVVLTATPDAVLKGISKEVFAVVKKPFQAGDLVATVARLA